MSRALNSERERIEPSPTPQLSLGTKLWALFFMCFLGFGCYFCFDNPGALQNVIVKDMDLTALQFSYLYSFYSWPNTVLCFVGGFLIDRVFGIRFGTALYAFIVLVGQIAFACGSLFDSFFVMVLGRLLFGIGGESLAVAQNYYAVLWFKGKALNMAFGLQLSFARIGSAVNFIVMAWVLEFFQHYFKGRRALGITLLAAGATCFFSFLCAVILGFWDLKRERVEQEEEENSEDDKDKNKLASLTDVKDFSAGFWLISIICIAYYIAIFPFIAFGNVFFMKKYEYTSSQANLAISLIYMMSGVLSPFLGFVVDKTGWNIFWVFISIIMTLGAHAMFAFSFYSPYIGVSLLGLGYSMCASALWPMVALITPRYQLGSAYGVAQALQNLGLAVSTAMAGMVVDSGGYFFLEMFFLAWLFVSLIACLILWIYDLRTTGLLNMTAVQREAMTTNNMRDRLVDRDYLAASSSEFERPDPEENMSENVYRTLR